MTMNVDLPPSTGSEKANAAGSGPVRGPVKYVRLLLPVWGEQYIIQFLRVSLPTLLASGNLPAVAAALPTTFVFLTNTEGAKLLSAHPAVGYLKTICGVEFDILDDLITGDNYSTTLTLGYARAVRATGPAMLDTCFFFLISDYIMADGSLGNVLKRIQSGFSGVLAGNFQVVEEDAKDSLFEEFDTDEVDVVITPRDLMAWALNYLHPMTLANTVNFPIYYSDYSNRLFWRVDENTLIGRFYLMHMIAIRPEITDFQVGSSCDYSFVPEMCPSGNVHVVSDSDEYLVVEMQRRAHEKNFIRLGAVDRSVLATRLAKWTTERHRLNAHIPIVYRASERSPRLPDTIVESRQFIEEVEAGLPGPQPFRDHPYWIGAIAAHRREVWRRQQKSNLLQSPKEEVTKPAFYHDFLFAVRDLIFGWPAKVWPWHPRWPDYQMVHGLADRYLCKEAGGRTLVLSSTPALFQSWLKGPNRTTHTLNIHHMLAYDAEDFEQLIGKFDGCLLVLVETELSYLDELLTRIKALLATDDCVVTFVLNGHGLSVGRQFNVEILREGRGFSDRQVDIEAVEFVVAGWAAWAALRGLRHWFGLTMRNPILLPIAIFPIFFLLCFSLVANFIGRNGRPNPFKNKLCSSIGVVMRIVGTSLYRPKTKDSSELKLSRLRFLERRSQARHLASGKEDSTGL